MKKTKDNCLIVVQGINEDSNYMDDAFDATGLELIDYDMHYVNTEIVFDRGKEKKDGFFDQYGDITQFYFRKDARVESCRKVRRAVREARKLGYERVDVLSHSLGSIITMLSGSNDKHMSEAQLKGGYVHVNNFICMGSPLSIDNWALGLLVRSHVRRFCRNFEADKVFYVYSFNDFVCKFYEEKIKKVLGKFTIDITPARSTSDHSILKYLLDFNRFLERKNWKITTKAIS